MSSIGNLYNYPLTTRIQPHYTVSVNTQLPMAKFNSLFLTEDACIEILKRIRYPQGIYCEKCKKTTGHYKISGRTAYSCTYCRRQVYPLTGTIFEKSTTSLHLWFYAMYLMTQTRAQISARKLQYELAVTYKTAWRMHRQIYMLMSQNNGDLLAGPSEKVRKWTFFNKFEIKVVQKKGR